MNSEDYRLNGMQKNESAQKSTATDILGGKTFVITGTLPGLKREEAAEIIKKNGGKVSSSVSGATDFLLCGSDPGSKLTKAQKLGVTVIGIDELRNMIENI